ncbi:hypothetical protein EVAR_45638_1 [Eumeta japonica]|uniref:Uncharacterized protein n=1 Tax=Eumeta variegata TaxID=151549 RepID=A0A4C1Y2C9_EUMVA|nr:hypothetical protein EVAR_45638_1 [Eumeta japonica]
MASELLRTVAASVKKSIISQQLSGVCQGASALSYGGAHAPPVRQPRDTIAPDESASRKMIICANKFSVSYRRYLTTIKALRGVGDCSVPRLK